MRRRPSRATLFLCMLAFVFACDQAGPKNSSPGKAANGSPASQADSTIRITSPTDQSYVAWRPTVQGTVSDPNATVWVVVHPVNTGGYWVQPSVGVGGDAKWRVQVYVGRAPDADVDVHFEIMAVAQPKANLKEGDVLGAWPTAEAKSQIIDVIRK